MFFNWTKHQPHQISLNTIGIQWLPESDNQASITTGIDRFQRNERRRLADNDR